LFELLNDKVVYFIHAQIVKSGGYDDSHLIGEPQSFTAEKNGVAYTIPLPNGAVETEHEDRLSFGGKQFAAKDKESGRKYHNILKSLPDYEYESFGHGTMVELKSTDANITFRIVFSRNVHGYELLDVSYY